MLCTFLSVKRAYHKLSLKVHPDRVHGSKADKTEATKKFQALGKTYSILSDKEKKAVYDETGKILIHVSLIFQYPFFIG